MEDPAGPDLEQDISTASSEEALEPIQGRRRAFVKTMLGATIGSALGYLSYPWVAGNRQHELAAHWDSFRRHLQEAPRKARRTLTESSEQHCQMKPVLLDATGREYEAFLASLNLRHIKPIEMLRPHFKMRGTVSNDLPPRECWKNIAPTLKAADELRERLGVRLLTIASAYRSPAYNAACPGAATHSYHVQNMALDLVFECSPQEVAKAAEALRATGFFAGGIGRYPTFTHIDTRGRAADWG